MEEEEEEEEEKEKEENRREKKGKEFVFFSTSSSFPQRERGKFLFLNARGANNQRGKSGKRKGKKK